MSIHIKAIGNATEETTLIVTNKSITPHPIVTVDENANVNPEWEISDNASTPLHLKLETSDHANELYIWWTAVDSSVSNLHYKHALNGTAKHVECHANADLRVTFQTEGGIIIIGTADIGEE